MITILYCLFIFIWFGFHSQPFFFWISFCCFDVDICHGCIQFRAIMSHMFCICLILIVRLGYCLDCYPCICAMLGGWFGLGFDRRRQDYVHDYCCCRGCSMSMVLLFMRAWFLLDISSPKLAISPPLTYTTPPINSQLVFLHHARSQTFIHQLALKLQIHSFARMESCKVQSQFLYPLPSLHAHCRQLTSPPYLLTFLTSTHTIPCLHVYHHPPMHNHPPLIHFFSPPHFLSLHHIFSMHTHFSFHFSHSFHSSSPHEPLSCPFP